MVLILAVLSCSFVSWCKLSFAVPSLICVCLSQIIAAGVHKDSNQNHTTTFSSNFTKSLLLNGVYSLKWRLTGIWGGGHLQGHGRAGPTPISANRATFCRNCASRVSRAFECPPLAFPWNKDEWTPLIFFFFMSTPVHCNPLLFRSHTIFGKGKIRRFGMEKISVAWEGSGQLWTSSCIRQPWAKV